MLQQVDYKLYIEMLGLVNLLLKVQVLRYMMFCNGIGINYDNIYEVIPAIERRTIAGLFSS